MRHPAYNLDSACPIEACLELLSGKWKGAILEHLQGGTLRFSELADKMPGITSRTLTQQLRKLEEGGIVERTVHPEVPPRVEYALTPLGRQLEPVLASLRTFGSTWLRESGRVADGDHRC